MTGPSHHQPLPPPHGVARIVSFDERDIEDAKRLLTTIAAGRSAAPAAQPADQEHGELAGRLRDCARKLYDDRQRRIAHFGSQMFSEPGWEMLLILYLEEGGERQSQTRLIELSGASRSTGARWLDHLVRKGLAQREDHPTDKRRNFLTLSEKGRKLLELYLSETCG